MSLEGDGKRLQTQLWHYEEWAPICRLLVQRHRRQAALAAQVLQQQKHHRLKQKLSQPRQALHPTPAHRVIRPLPAPRTKLPHHYHHRLAQQEQQNKSAQNQAASWSPQQQPLQPEQFHRQVPHRLRRQQLEAPPIRRRPILHRAITPRRRAQAIARPTIHRPAEIGGYK